ncbi:sulfite exporter TauE/SafE family protein [Estrella lausannensis]|uniref:Conserved putative membrane protein n=1 Tax=Estrella lausannensis TaxID=483423 RepID=A0A0H5DQS2_9BACT|nr:sulfite exporter TauE/SafE family protein [Estrella lausannensis]CRX38897.1 Conserved putative membrane protein [Estrella lausannensis]
MALLLSMLPVYLAGNLHCIGMCGPLVMTISSHPYRMLYFFGRALSFSLLGLTSATFGMALEISLKNAGIPALASFLFGFLMLFFTCAALISEASLMPSALAKRLAKASGVLASFLLRGSPAGTFYFGFFTPLLPCGQTLLVFSAIALFGDPLAGLVNGFLFALLTSPSLFLAMKVPALLRADKKKLNYLLPLAAAPAALLAILRGSAEMGWINHMALELPLGIHLALY